VLYLTHCADTIRGICVYNINSHPAFLAMPSISYSVSSNGIVNLVMPFSFQKSYALLFMTYICASHTIFSEEIIHFSVRNVYSSKFLITNPSHFSRYELSFPVKTALSLSQTFFLNICGITINAFFLFLCISSMA